MVSSLCRQHSTHRCLPGHCWQKCSTRRSLFLRASGWSYSHAEPDCYSKCKSHTKRDSVSNSDTHNYANSDTNRNADSKAYADTKISSNPETSPNSSRVSALAVTNPNLTDEIHIQVSIRLF